MTWSAPCRQHAAGGADALQAWGGRSEGAARSCPTPHVDLEPRSRKALSYALHLVGGYRGREDALWVGAQALELARSGGDLDPSDDSLLRDILLIVSWASCGVTMAGGTAQR